MQRLTLMIAISESEANMSLPYKEISAALDSIQAEVKKGLEVEVDGETGVSQRFFHLTNTVDSL